MIKYYIFEEELSDKDIGKYCTYGVYTSDNRKISDVSLDYERLEDLIKRMNEGELHPIHLMDVIEDFLIG